MVHKIVNNLDVARPQPDVEALLRILEWMRRLLDRGDQLGASDENAKLHRRLLEIAVDAT